MAAPTTAPASVLPSILLVLSAAFTIAVARHSPARPEKACREALGLGGASLVTFCARDMLGDKAAVLAAGDGKWETLSVVLKESYKRAEAFEDLGMRLASDESKEGRDLRSCWGLMNDVVSSVGNIYANVAAKKLSMDAVMSGAYERAKVANGKCKFSGAARRGGVWVELKAKAKETLKAETVALAFMNQFHAVLN